jgi:DNA-binding SARP family transcriptional activator/tetratricopeptide (TPR) repeat protein
VHLVTFTVFGAVRAYVAGGPCEVPGRRERAVLSVLLGRRGQVVSADRIVAEVWGDHPPERARSSLQVAVSHLRSALEPERTAGTPPRVIVSSGAGYVLDVPPEAVDADRFVGLVTRAHDLAEAGDHDGVLAAAEEAEALRIGAPYPDLGDGDIVRGEVQRLDELWWSLQELRAASLIAKGRPVLAVAPLEALVAEHPFREHAWRLLALALYRCRRQADALAAVRRARQRLVEELGVDPSPELQRLEQDLLAQSPDLEPEAAPDARTPGAAPATSADQVGVTRAGRPPRTSGGDDMVGQGVALGAVAAAVSAVCESPGRGATLVVTGEAGIGKTRLATVASELAAEAGARVLWGRCHEADVAPAYWPWVPVVRALAGPSAAPEVAALVDPGGARTAEHAESAALRTYDAVCRLVAGAAEQSPAVIVLEDLHWADSASLQLAAYAAEALADHPVLLLLTVRVPEEAPPGLTALLAALARLSVPRVHLEGLDPPQVQRLVTTLTGRAVEEELAAVVAERTDGNPFFVIELVRLLNAEHRFDAAGARAVTVPDGVQDVLRLRLGRLPDEVHRLLAVASVCGRDFDLELLATVTSSDTGRVLELLDVAAESRIVEDAETPGHHRFAHALVRETLYAGLSRSRRGLLHAAIGEALEPRVDGEPDLVTEVAHHLVLGCALRPELAPSAVAHAMAAARLAEALGAFDRARDHWEEALAADRLSRERSPRRRYGVLLGLGVARYRQGDIVGSREALDEAVAIARAMDEVEMAAAAATSFRGAGIWHWREFGTSDPEMQQVLRECLDLLPEGALQARVLASLAMELMYEWRSLEAEPFSQRSMEVARAVGDPVLLAEVAALREMVLFGRPGATDERLAIAEELLALDLGPEYELYTRFGAACALMQTGDADAADRQMTRCVELARRLRHTGADVPLAWWQFYRAMARDDRAEAAVLLERAVERHRRSSVVAVVDLEAGARLRMAGAQAVIPDDLLEFTRAHANPAFRAFIASALVEVGDAARGAGLLGEPVPDGAWDYAATYGDCLRVAVLATAGDVARLPDALRRIEPWAHEFASYGSTECVGSVAYFVGRGKEALGDRAGAEASYAAAVESNRRGGMVVWQARAEDRLAGLAGQARQEGQAGRAGGAVAAPLS